MLNTTGRERNSMPPEFAERLESCFTRIAGSERGRNARIAERLGVTSSMVTYWTHGYMSPNLPRLIQIAKMAHCSLDWLLTGEMFD